MSERLYKFSGAGNDFVVLDGRGVDVSAFRETERISAMCRRFRTDGLMILDQADGFDFTMDFYNPDGSGGMMCGNGGRCIVAFADYLGLRPHAEDGVWHFLAPDGPHTAAILDRQPERWTVRLKMIDVQGIAPVKDGYFLNTGTRHYVQFVPDVADLDIEAVAKPIRWDPAFQPEGTNVNLVQVAADGLHVRTFEKGVEGETLACGTGITASAIAAWKREVLGAERRRGSGGLGPQLVEDSMALQTVSYRLQCRRGDWLQVDFRAQGPERFSDVYLTGPAELVNIFVPLQDDEYQAV